MKTNTYAITYTLENDNTKYIGWAYGQDEAEALTYFDTIHRNENYEIKSISFYK